jgi:PAS domain S-box-containing protein
MHPSRRGLFFTLAILIAIQIMSGALAYQHTRNLRKDAARVAHSHEVVAAVQTSLTTMIDAETGQRGYLLTGNPLYLNPYHDAGVRIGQSVQRVKQLLQADPRQSGTFRIMESLIQAKREELAHTIALQQKDPRAARSIVLTDQGRNLMVAIREQAQTIILEEQLQLSVRERASARSYRVAVTSGLVFFLLGLAMTAWLLRALLRHLRELARQQQALHVILHSIGDGLVTCDPAGRVTLMNPAAARMAARDPEQAIGQPFTTVFPMVNGHADERVTPPGDRLPQAGLTPDRASSTLLVNRAGLAIPVEDRAAPILDAAGHVAGMVLVFRDVTDRIRAEREKAGLEAQIRKARETEQLGMLAGGIAHDFNNLLTSILGNANLATLVVEADGQAAHHLDAIEAAALKAADLTRQMLAYAGQGKFLVKGVDLHIVLQEVLQLLSADHPGLAAVQYDLLDALPSVEGDATQIAQVVMNLMINADEAGAEAGPATITVRTGREELGEAASASSSWVLPAAAGSFATLEVTDQGSGMPPEVLARAFDPFYTTKFVGRGLGLAAVIGILRNHRGGLWVRSEPGHGSSFKIFLPTRPGPEPVATAGC